MARPPDPDAHERILRVASALFYEHGIRAVGMARVIDGAGCGKNLLYRHFPSKEDLVLAYLERAAGIRDDAIRQAVSGLERVPSAALVAITREAADRVSDPEFGGCPFRSYLREMRETDDRAGSFALGQIEGVRTRIEALVADLGTEDPDRLTERIWLVLEGLYASVSYADRAGTATAGVGLVQELLAAA